MLLSTIAAPVEAELIIKRSRFLAQVVPVASVGQADTVIANVRKAHWNANHNCMALVLGVRGETARSSDDGEPSGTAGVPMLEVLRQQGLTDIVAVVTRYFGGVKLGAGGLVRAYSSAVATALTSAAIVRRRWLTSVMVAVPHADAGRIENWVRDWVADQGGTVGSTTYGVSGAQLSAMLPPAALEGFTAGLAAISAGALSARIGENQVADVPA